MDDLEARGVALQTALESVLQIQSAYGRAVARARDILVAELDYTPGEAVMELFSRDLSAMKQALKVWEGLQAMFPDIYGLEMK